MKSNISWLALLLGAIGVMAIAFNWWLREYQEAPPPVTLRSEALPAPQGKVESQGKIESQAKIGSQIRYPIEAARQDAGDGKPLPALGESDATMRESLAGLIEHKLAQLFYSDAIVRRLVATIDNLPREEAALRLMPVKPATGLFDTSGDRDSPVISSENYRRYAPMVRLIESVDAKKLVGEYAHFYPLFQRQYQELGYPNGYFNDRLVEVIDHLLAAPEVRGPVQLTRPRILWKFADPKLESLSAGQKAMIRMGPANAVQVKAKLKEIRSALTGPAKTPAPAAAPGLSGTPGAGGPLGAGATPDAGRTPDAGTKP